MLIIEVALAEYKGVIVFSPTWVSHTIWLLLITKFELYLSLVCM